MDGTKTRTILNVISHECFCKSPSSSKFDEHFSGYMNTTMQELYR